jgi:hypothetical protein
VSIVRFQGAMWMTSSWEKMHDAGNRIAARGELP